MQIQVIAVGKLKERYWVQAIEEYAKRLRPYTKLRIVEVSDEKAPDQLGETEEKLVKDKEGGRILAQIKPETYVISLALDGQMWTSEQLSRQMEQQATYGNSQITFVIGGSLGLSEAVLQRANQKLSFGSMTYPHQLMRVILIEQIYRAFKIMKGEPYHK